MWKRRFSNFWDLSIVYSENGEWCGNCQVADPLACLCYLLSFHVFNVQIKFPPEFFTATGFGH